MKQILSLFLKLGCLGFGGPIALIGYMEDECVDKRKWLSREEYYRFVAVAKLFPGPLATLIAVRIGKAKHPRWGGWLAGISLILPSFLLILALAQGISIFDRFEMLRTFWVGLTLAALAVAFNATINFSKPLLKSKVLSRFSLIMVLTISSCFTLMFPKLEIGILLFFGFFGLTLHLLKKRRTLELGSMAILIALFWGCFRASLFTFGSGIAIIPVLRSIFIDELHVVTSQQFLQGLTLGQITPGPFTIVSAYLGWVASGFWGALISTVGTFLPTFIFGIYVMPNVEGFILKSKRLSIFFEWLVTAVCGAIFGALVRLALMSIIVNQRWEWTRGALVVILLAAMIHFRLSPGRIFILGGILAYLL